MYRDVKLDTNQKVLDYYASSFLFDGRHFKANIGALEHCKCRWTEGLKFNNIPSERSWQFRKKWHQTTTTRGA